MKIILPGNPISTNQIYRRHGHTIYMSNEGKARKEYYQLVAKSQSEGRMPLTRLVKVRIKLFFKDKRVRDIDNYCKILLDSLTGIVWVDDKQIQRMTVEKSIDAVQPRIEIEII